MKTISLLAALSLLLIIGIPGQTAAQTFAM